MPEKNKILIVDDDKKNVELLEAFLTGTNFEVIRAYGGKEAIELVKKERLALILRKRGDKQS